MAFIDLRDLTKRYDKGVVALNGVTAGIGEGEWIAVTGPSGSGKSTLIHLLAGLDRPTSGEIRVGGAEITALSASQRVAWRRETVGLVFQQAHLVPHLTAVENVMLAQYFHSLPDRAEAMKALEEVGVADRAAHLPGELSGGERQRVCLARALINHPKLILADEPTANLDEANERQVLEILARWHDRGRTIVVVTHDADVARMASRRMEIRRGVLSSSGRTSREREEAFDEVLQQLWETKEGPEAGAECADNPPLLGNRAVLMEMAAFGLVAPEDSRFVLTEKGEARARDLIRRHRLAERLFEDALKMEGEAVESNACLFEHVLSPEVTEGVCKFLGHPAACPHRRPIPPGACCGAPVTR